MLTQICMLWPISIWFVFIITPLNYIDDIWDFFTFGLTLLTACLTIFLMYTASFINNADRTFHCGYE